MESSIGRTRCNAVDRTFCDAITYAGRHDRAKCGSCERVPFYPLPAVAR